MPVYDIHVVSGHFFT